MEFKEGFPMELEEGSGLNRMLKKWLIKLEYFLLRKRSTTDRVFRRLIVWTRRKREELNLGKDLLKFFKDNAGGDSATRTPFEVLYEPEKLGFTEDKIPKELFNGISFGEGLNSKNPLIRSRFSWKVISEFPVNTHFSKKELSLAISNVIPGITRRDKKLLIDKIGKVPAPSADSVTALGGRIEQSVSAFEELFSEITAKYVKKQKVK